MKSLPVTIGLNMDGEIEITQTTVMSQEEFLRYAVELRGVQKGVQRDPVADLLPGERTS